MKRYLQVLTVSFLIVTAGMGCRNADDADRPGGPHGMQPGATVDTTELRRTYDAIDEDHERMMAQYQQMAPEMQGDVRRMYETMQQMHDQVMPMHRQMMGAATGDGGMMDDRPSGRGMMRDEPSGHGMMGRGMMGEGMMHSGMMGEWDRQMVAMHQQMAGFMRQQGYDDMAELHDQMMQHYQGAADALPESTEGDRSDEAAQDAERAVSGQSIFQQYCATCHGADGRGLTTAFPPLAGADWVTGNPETLIRVVLHGLQGEIEVGGQTYDGTMPAFGARLSDEEVAAVSSYVRNAWGNSASAISSSEVRRVREESADRTRPWSPSAVR